MSFSFLAKGFLEMFNSLRSIKLAAASLALALTISACTGGGAGGGGAVTPAASGGGGNTTPQSVPAVVKYILPASFTTTSSARGASSTGRKPMFVSPSTNGTVLTVYQHGTTTVVAPSPFITDVSAGSPNCVGTAPRICTLPISLPPGTYDFALKTYDAAPVAGAIPGGAKQLAQSSLTQTIVALASNTINFSLSGIVVGPPGIACASVCGSISYMSLPADGSTHNFGLAISATDADGNIIGGSVPYASPIAVSLAETGGSGHSQLVINGVASGSSGTLTKGSDTLAVRYDGGGSSGYTTVTTVGSSTLTISPMFVGPALASVNKLSDVRTANITEANAPGGIAYSSSAAGCAQVSSTNATGSGAAATLHVNTSASAGYVGSCNITVSDVLGSSLTIALPFSVAGPITIPTPTLPTGVSGTCATQIAMTAAGQAFSITMSDPNYAGAFSLTNTTPATATASLSGATATITSVAAGTTTVTISDTAGNSFACNIGVTTSSGTVN